MLVENERGPHLLGRGGEQVLEDIQAQRVEARRAHR
jgi:hypothetical protein